MAFNNQLTTLVIPFGATSGPRIIIDGDEGTIKIIGNSEEDFILIDPTGGADGRPIINFQDSDNPGDLLAGIQWDVGFGGPIFRGTEYIEAVFGELVRPYIRLRENLLTIGFNETANNNFVGGVVSLREDSARLAFADDSGVIQYMVNATDNGMQLYSLDGSLTEREAYTSNNDAITGTTTYGPGTAHSIEFVAPATGAVEVFLQGWLSNNSATIGRRSYLSTEVREGATVGSGTIVAAADDTQAAVKEKATAGAAQHYGYVSVMRRVYGLTPGDTYHVRSMFRPDNSADTAHVNRRRMYIRPMIMGVDAP